MTTSSLSSRVRTRQLGDDVVAARVGGEILRVYLNAYPYGYAVLQHANEVVVVLPGDDDGRHLVRAEVARLHEDRSVLASARLEHRADAGVVQYRLDLLRLGRSAAAATASSAADGSGGRVDVSRWTEWVGAVLTDEVRHHGLREDDRALERAAHFLERIRRQPGDENRRADDLALRRRGPRVGIPDHRREARGRHLERVLLQLPSPAERPRFHVDVGESPRRQMIAGPRRGAHERRGRGEARPDHGREGVDHRPGARVVHSFVADPREDGIGLLEGER